MTSDRVGRLVFIALQVRDLDASTHFYRDVLGVPLSVGDNGDTLNDRWIGDEHQEYSWREGAYLHFALFPRPPSGSRQSTRNSVSPSTTFGPFIIVPWPPA